MVSLNSEGQADGTSYESPMIEAVVANGDKVSFEYQGDCGGGAPRVFIQGGVYNTADAEPNDANDPEYACGTAIGGGWYRVTGTVTNATAGPAGYVGIVNDNTSDPRLINVRNLIVAGVDVSLGADEGPAGDDSTDGTNGTNGTNGQNGAPGAQGPAGTIGPSGQEFATNAVVIRSKRLKSSRRRKVKVAVSCPRTNGLCEGRIRLVRNGRILVSQTFEMRGGRNAKVTLTLSKKVFRGLGKGKRVQINVFNRDLAGTASTSGRTVRLTR